MKQILITLCFLGMASMSFAQFTKSFTAGTTDPNGNFMGGTEMRVLAKHKGMLFGGMETWKDDTTGTCDPFIGAQIVRLESPTGAWKLDKHFDTFFPELSGRERKRNEGITALESVVFRTDKNGVALVRPDTILIAAARDFTGVLSVYTRNDGANVSWTEKQIGSVALDTVGSTDNDGTIRSFILYRDKITGVDRIFAGSLPNGIISGAYDASLPGKILWDTLVPELTGFVGRPMAFTVCNGDLYCAIAPKIYRRNDGPTPSWTSVFTYPFNVTPGGSSGLRGLSTVKNPNGPGESLLAALEGQISKIYRLTPSGNLPYTATIELDIDTLMSSAFGYPGNYYVVANSEMSWVTQPVTGDSILTITIQHHPANIRDDAYYLLRRQVGSVVTYALRRIENMIFAPLTILNSTRAIVSSPFPNDGNFVYIGGYDADDNISHNTAYVLRANKAAFFNPPANPVLAPGLKHRTIIPSLTDAAIDNAFGYHQTYVNTGVAPLNRLFLYIPGSNSSPIAYDAIQKQAANAGYHVLGISYSNATISPLCAGKSDSLCFDKVRGEVIDGIDRTNLVDVNVANSIYNRVLKVLQYLTNKYPAENWGQYLDGNGVLWGKVAIGGHSQGGGHAAFIAKQKLVDRVLLWASPKDYFTAPLNKPAAWINRPTNTPACKYFALVHQADNLGCTPAQQLLIFKRLGIDTFASGLTFFESSNGNYNNSHVILSNLSGLSGSSAHNIVAVDIAAATFCNRPYFEDVWEYMLVQAGCPVLGTASIQTENSFSVYPNPFIDRIQIQPVTGNENYLLANITGQILYAGNQISTQDFSGIAPGIYFLRIATPNAPFITIKLVKP